MEGIRLNRFLAAAGLGSRRSVESLIQQKKVQVNGKIAVDYSLKIFPSDSVCVDGREVNQKSTKYYMLYKPAGYVTTRNDPQQRNTVMELIPDGNVYPVGRLDRLSRGLLLFTNDGELAFRLMHPSYMIWKEYVVQVNKVVTSEKLDMIRNGIEIEGKITAPAEADIIAKNNMGCILRIRLREGKKREIRRMCRAIAVGVIDLLRVKIGNLELGDLPEGSYRELSEQEVLQLHQLVGIKN